MNYLTVQQTIDLLNQELPPTPIPYDLPQLADLCRQAILTPVFAYNSYGMEVLEYYDGKKPLIYENGVEGEPQISKFPEPMTTSLYNNYFTHVRLTTLLDKSSGNLVIDNAITYESDGSGHEVVLVDNPLNINRYPHDENYSVYSDNDGYTVSHESLLFPSEQVQSYIASKQLPDAKESLSQQTDKPAKTNIDEGQGDTLLILGAVMQCIESVAKSNYTQTNFIDEIIKKYPNTKSISQSTLTKKFSKAKTHLKQNVTP